MQLASSDVDGTSVVAVSGEIDVYTAPRLRSALDARLAAGATRLVVDLSRVELVDSTGLGVLVGRLKILSRTGGSIALVIASDRVGRVFSITGLDTLFPIHGSLDEALAARSDGPGAA